jgi:hypothetical protein
MKNPGLLKRWCTNLLSPSAFLLLAIVTTALSQTAFAQQTPAFNYKDQKNFIHKEIGKVYLGMPFKKFAEEFNLTKASVGDLRFDWFEITIPLNSKNIESVRVRIHGLTPVQKTAMIVSETVSTGDDDDVEVDRLQIGKIPVEGFVYAMYLTFKPEFDLKSYAIKTYGKDGNVRSPDDEYYFYDIQWTKRTGDGLTWLIRSFHEGDKRNLQLLGRIDGTEWGLD